ncbi:FG-GAP-like repeat-containing protein [Chondrinema litorale]|uniref:FG-GAP-like repeat-containing protein n=1 Tax=Chondrinema litorale TaxID=2994555 RepID=UPI00254376C3|nr:FG-GAP-like repeat-containing protein [Chondrinema litorale]UZR96570.1 gliding motility-associated C-terminal domain-containing protein [Chondrinema litorale]
MKKTAFIFYILWLSIAFFKLQAQIFNPIDFLQFPKLSNPEMVWADLSNNGFQDAIICGVDSTGMQSIFILSNAKDSIEIVPSLLPALVNPKFSLADINHDAFLDVFISGTDSTGTYRTEVWENQGELNFTPSSISITGWQSATSMWVDLDWNGDYDLVMSGVDETGNNQFKIYKNTSGSFEELEPEIPALANTSFEQLDANRNGYRDLLITGTDSSNNYKTYLLLNNQNFEFQTEEIETDFGGSEINVGDINHDGFSDIILSGKTATRITETRIYLNTNSGSYELYETLNNWQAHELLIADLDKDGLADIFFAGIDENDEHKTAIYQYDSVSITPAYILLDTLLPSASKAALSDVDLDGDLDVFLFSENADSTGIYINDFKGKNYAPATPYNPFAIAIHGKTLFSWLANYDDLTAREVLTYELFAGTREYGVDYVSPYFHTEGGVRKMTAHGNIGQNNFFTLNKLISGRVFWGVQPVDNSLANNASNNSICTGNVLYDCVDIELKDTLLCFGNSLQLVDPIEDKEAIWFSVNQGYLGTFDTLNISLAADDTIFYVVPNDLDCALATSWSIKILEQRENISLGNDTTVCEGEVLTYQVPEGEWTEISWLSESQGELSTENEITFEVFENDQLILITKDSAGCVFSDSVLIKLFETTAYASEDTTITEGESVKLAALNALSYLWSPNYAIDDVNSSTPTISPLNTTEYIVTMLDSTGCTVIDTVLVTVEGSIATAQVFIPNLFTPNNDGNNDAFRLYGLENVNSISFQIYDAQGNQVFGSDNIGTLQHTGWDGSKSGRTLKNGTYFWRLNGEYQNGEPILFEGKQEGFITLLR